MSLTTVTLQWDSPSGAANVSPVSMVFSSSGEVVDGVSLKLQELGGWYSTPSQYNNLTDYPLADGAWAPWRGYLGAREISLTGWITGTAEATRRAWQTLAAISPGGAPFVIEVVDDVLNIPLTATVFKVDMAWQAVREGAFRFQLTMLAADPYKYGAWQTVEGAASVNVPYAGTQVSPAVIEVVGPLTTGAWNVGNTLGERVSFASNAASLTPGQVLVITPDLGGQVWRDGESLTHLAGTTSAYPRLYPQVAGTPISFTRSGGSGTTVDTRLRVSWRDAYL